MNEALHPYATAGTAMVGASMIAIAPVATPLPDISQVRDVQLTGTSDILSIPFNTFQDALTNDGNLSLAFVDANNALVDAIQTNPDWFSALTNPHELFGALTFLAGDQKNFLNPLAEFTTSLPSGTGGLGAPDFFLGNFLLYGLLTNQGGPLLPGIIPEIPAPIPEIAQVAASPLSGLLLGAVSPMVAPLVPFLNPFMELIADIQSGTSPDIGQLAQELLAAPLNSINAFFNGDTLDLDALVPLVNQAGLLPEGTSIVDLSVAFGGLLSPGEVGGTLDALSQPELPPPLLGGGSILNALGITISAVNPVDPTLPPIVLQFGPGEGVGPYGALIGLERVIAELLSGNLDFGSGSGGAAAVDVGSLFPDLSQLFSGDLFNFL